MAPNCEYHTIFLYQRIFSRSGGGSDDKTATAATPTTTTTTHLMMMVLHLIGSPPPPPFLTTTVITLTVTVDVTANYSSLFVVRYRHLLDGAEQKVVKLMSVQKLPH
jgi:hypothetical protein